MGNMSYCRFQNTLADLTDCRDALSNMCDISELSKEEQNAARKLVAMCSEIGADFEGFVDD